MTETYEEFIALKIKEMDVYIVVIFNEYEKKTSEYHFQRDDYVDTIENTEDWFDECFFNFIYRDENIQWINEYQLDNLITFKFKEQLVMEYVYTVVPIEYDNDEDMTDNWLKCEININFVNNYIINILDFNHLKNILYDHGIYNEVFAEEVELK